MRWGIRWNRAEAGRILTRLAGWVIRIVGILIFLGLSWYAFRYTQYMNTRGSEIPVNVHDSMLRNLAILAVGIFLLVELMMLDKILPEKSRMLLRRCSLAFSMLWVGGWSLWWITAADRQPVGDQAFIYGGASMFMEGMYSFLGSTGYCGMCPHQLGLMALLEVYFHIVGPHNYYAFQVLCVLLATGIVFLGYDLIRLITDRTAPAVMYCLMMTQCLPLIFYTGWVYGEIPSIFCMMLAACCLLHYRRSGKWGWLAAMVAACILAMLVRENSMIFVIALGLVGVLYSFCKKDWKLLGAVVLAALLPYMAYQGIYKMYEVRSGYPHSDGFASLSYITMGLQERDGKFGWYSLYCREVYDEQGQNTRLASEVSKQDLKRRLEEFRNDPEYTKVFFREKILSQWNAPLCQSLYFNTQYWEHTVPDPDSLVSRIDTDYFVSVLHICDRMQFLLYIGMLCYFLFAVRKDSDLLQQLLAVTVIGGFLFSIIWEAKPRYSFTYYVTMYPMAVLGYQQLLRQAMSLLQRFRKKKEKDNLIPFRRAA